MAFSEEIKSVPQAIQAPVVGQPLDKQAEEVIMKILENKYINKKIEYFDFSNILLDLNLEKIRKVVLKTLFAMEKSQNYKELLVATIWAIADERYKEESKC